MADTDRLHLIKLSHVLNILIVYYHIFIPPPISMDAAFLLCIPTSVQLIVTCKKMATWPTRKYILYSILREELNLCQLLKTVATTSV